MARRLVVLMALVLLALAVVPAAGASAEGAPVTVDRAGWWTKAQGVADPVVGGTPLAGVIPATPVPPSVPEGTYPVTAFGGEAQSSAAIGFTIDAPAGTTVQKLVLQVASDPAGDQNASSAAILACPITDFWGETENGKYSDVPAADCSKGAKGTRADDGVWSFDLTAVAGAWFDQFGTLSQNGVLLTEGADAPGTFQVAFQRPPGSVSFDVDLTPGTGADDPFASGGSSFDSGGSFSSGGSSFDVGGGPLPVVGGSATAPSTPSPTSRSGRPRTLPQARTIGTRGGDVVGNLPLLLLLLVPLTLAAAALAGRALGGPSVEGPRVRHGGVSRALQDRAARRRAALDHPEPT